MKQKKFLAWGTLILFVLLGIGFGIDKMLSGHYGRGVLGFFSIAFLGVPFLIGKVVGGHPYLFYAELFAFCILAYDVGSVYHAFDSVPFLDKIAHFLSGFVFTTLGGCVYLFLNRTWQHSLLQGWNICISYGVFFSCFIAILWEVFEFMGFILFAMDSQHTLTTGVFDTMYDLLGCLLGSLACALFMVLYKKAGLKLVTVSVLEDFYQQLSPAKI